MTQRSDLLSLVLGGVLRLFLVLLSGAIALLIVELFLRLFNPLTVDVFHLSMRDYELRPHSALGYVPRPNSGEFNADGMRKLVHDSRGVNRPQGMNRVVLLGDSLTYGAFVPLPQIASEQLDLALNSGGRSSGRGFEILNLGVPGYSFLQSLLWLEEKGLSFQPSFLYYHYWFDDLYLSDPGYKQLSNSWSIRLIQAVRGLLPGPMEELFDQILRRSQLARRVLVISLQESPATSSDSNDATPHRHQIPSVALQSFKELKRDLDAGILSDQPGQEGYYRAHADLKLFTAFTENLRRLRQICDSRTIDCTVLLTPILHFPAGAESYPYDRLHEHVATVFGAYGFPVIDLRQEFFELGASALQVRKHDSEHFNALGHRLLAERLQADLLEKLSRGPRPEHHSPTETEFDH